MSIQTNPTNYCNVERMVWCGPRSTQASSRSSSPIAHPSEPAVWPRASPPTGTSYPAPSTSRALATALGSAAIAVNATTVGKTTNTAAFDVAGLPEGALVFDLVYVPPITPLVRAATARGLQVCNGMEMLVRQGEIAFERWTGIGSTVGVMRSTLEVWLADSETED